MGKRETIDNWSWGYFFTNHFLVTPIHNFFYKKIEIKFDEKIPKNHPIIFAPNHQNALMDALSFVAGSNQFQTVFLARADVFTSKFVRNILTFLKILPVYRIRDGRSSLQKNDDIFDIASKIVTNKKNPLCLYPEGNHGDKRRIRPLVKGLFRIAFKAQEKYKSQSGVKIIPVCIDYGHYWKFRQTQLMVFGDPIEVCDYWKDFEENPPIAMNKLRDSLSEEMKKTAIHIETEEYYYLYMDLRSIYGKTMCKKMNLRYNSLYNQYLASKEMISRLDQCLEKSPEKIKELNSVFRKYASLRKRLNFRDWVPQKKRYSILINGLGMLLSLVTLPLVVLGLFNNWPHFFIPPRLGKKIKDSQFRSTAIWGFGFVLIVIYYLILFVLALIFLPFWWIKLLYIVTLPSSGIFALSYRKFIIKSWARIRYTFGKFKKGSDTGKMKENYDKLIYLTDQIIGPV